MRAPAPLRVSLHPGGKVSFLDSSTVLVAASSMETRELEDDDADPFFGWADSPRSPAEDDDAEDDDSDEDEDSDDNDDNDGNDSDADDFLSPIRRSRSSRTGNEEPEVLSASSLSGHRPHRRLSNYVARVAPTALSNPAASSTRSAKVRAKAREIDYLPYPNGVTRMMPAAFTDFISRYAQNFAPGYGITHNGPARFPKRGPFQNCQVQACRCGYASKKRASCPWIAVKVTHPDARIDFLEAAGEEFAHNDHTESHTAMDQKGPPGYIRAILNSPSKLKMGPRVQRAYLKRKIGLVIGKDVAGRKLRNKIQKWTKGLRRKQGLTRDISDARGSYGALCTVLETLDKDYLEAHGDKDGRPFGPHTTHLLAPPIIEPATARVTAVIT